MPRSRTCGDRDVDSRTPARGVRARAGRHVALFAALGTCLTLIGSLTVVAVLSGRAQSPSSIGAHRSSEPASEFVTRRGTRLFVRDDPYRFLGYNSYVMMGCGRDLDRLDVGQRERFFAGLRPSSVVRLWLFPGTDLARFDAVLDSAKRHGHRLIPTLTDAMGGCGDTAKDDRWYRHGYSGEYVSWINTVVPRYRDEPAIAMWELINEPHGTDPETLRRFFDIVGALVHRLDSNHLVSSGTLQPDTYGGALQYRHISASPGIDVMSLHEFDHVDSASWHARPAVEAARALDKPLLLGEWGLNAGPSGESCITLERRRDMAEAKLVDYLAEPVIAGALYWAYSRHRQMDCRHNTFEGDPLMQLIRTIKIP